jgi:endonuclease-3
METLAGKKRRVRAIMTALKRQYPDARCMLDYSNPLELLVATILAAQCTDKRVNMTTRELFRKYCSASDWANASQEELEKVFRPCGFFRHKAQSVRAACAEIEKRYAGKVPANMEELSALSGVGRKTANVVLGNALGVPSIIVDTHVIRVSGRLGLASEHNVKKKYADKIEKELLEVVPEKERTIFSHVLGFHGRAICGARKPRCSECIIARLCPYAAKTPRELFNRKSKS